MTPAEWQRVRSILESALELEPASRAKFLDHACAEASIRLEVESLIRLHEQAGDDFLHTPVNPAFLFDDEVHFRLAQGKRIGAYEILGEIAQGGMGAVYRAIRADGQYEQHVALKIVRADLGAEFTAARFRTERQILASLDHPNIAKILDGGTTVEGLPYFVMELIDGLPITEYCDGKKLSVDERLRLFQTVCSAVHYSHQHLVVHRDIKPTNILITSAGVPKLLDFGIAKLLDPAGMPENLTMTAGLWMMTPEYASPEQLRGEPITTATDVYSLGVVLYQLLTGHSPYRMDTRKPANLAEAITNDEPERPSVVVQRTVNLSLTDPSHELNPENVSSTREASPFRLQQRLQGDLDYILLKALRKEPDRRYASVDQFAQDIRSHLEGLPVTARKGTWSYRCGKFVQRHKAAVAAAVLILATLVTGITVTIREARIAEANRQRAEKRFNDVHKLANSLMFEVHDSIRQLPGATAARKLIIERSQQYLDLLAQDSQSDPALLRDLAAAYGRLASVQGNALDANLGNRSLSLQDYRRSVELLTACVSLEPSNRDNLRRLADGYENLAIALSHTGDLRGAKESAQKALLILEPMAKSYPEDQMVQELLGIGYERAGAFFADENDFIQAKEFYEKSLAVYQLLGAANPANRGYQMQLSFAHKHIGSVLLIQKQLPAALDHYRSALAIDELNLKLDPENAQTRYNITYAYSDTGLILMQQGEYDAALQYYGKALQIREALAAADPQDLRTRRGVANTYNYIGGVFLRKGDFAQSLGSYKKALAIRQALAEKDSANEGPKFEVADTEARIGKVYAAKAFFARTTASERLRFCREANSWMQKALPVYLERKNKGKLAGNDVKMPEDLSQEIDKCNQTIARSGRPSAPASR